MPYKTIQQNFSNGELNPKMQGRSDVDMYYKSAQKMRDVATTPYGGYVRRPGFQNIYRGAKTLTQLAGMETHTDLTAEEAHPVANIADLNDTTFFRGSSNGVVKPAGTVLASVADSLKSVTTEQKYYAYEGYSKIWYAWEYVGETTGFNLLYTNTLIPQSSENIFISTPEGEFERWGIAQFIRFNPETNILTVEFNSGWTSGVYSNYIRKKESDVGKNPFIVYTKESTSVAGNPIFSDINGTVYGYVTSVGTDTISDGKQDFKRKAGSDLTKTETTDAYAKTTKKISILNISSTKPQKLILKGFAVEGAISLLEFETGPKSKSFHVETDTVFGDVDIVSKNEEALDIQLQEFSLMYDNPSMNTNQARLFPFVFNNEQAYILSVTNKTVRIFRNDTLVQQLSVDTFTNEIIQTMRFAQTADTAIFVHPDLPPTQLKRGTDDNDWTISAFNLESVPKYNFEAKEPKRYNFAITPDVLDGTVKLSFTGTIEGDVVGQYLEGNGGRVKITQQEAGYLIGYTIIGFYTTDAIAANQWTITQDYEPVWSETRGWPNSVVFHQGRLWFGGSKSRPQTVWGSKVGLFGKFDPTSGYDDDAIEFTLDTNTLNKITDLYSQRNLQIFTLGGEFICQTSYNEPITPNNVNAVKQTANGSWPLTSPVDIEGQVIFMDRRGQALISFLYDSGQEAYSAVNSSLINSHLINQPVDLDVERNNLTQQTNYVYIVNNDGTLCVVNLLAAQGITGGFTLWEMNGKVRSVCVLPDATYIVIERSELTGNNLYLEKLDWKTLTDNTENLYANNQSQFVLARFANKKVDVLLEGKFVGQYTADDTGLIDIGKNITGNVEIGLPFRSYVQSNYLELPNMGAGVGKRKRLASMTVRVIDTPELTINGETQKLEGKDIEDVNFYAVGDWSIKPTWEFTQNSPYKFNVLAMQMNVNYEVAND